MKRNLIIIMCIVAAALSAAAGEVTFRASTDGFGPGQRIGARLLELLKPYSGTPDTTATVKILFDRAGTYYLDRSLRIHCNLEMEAVKDAKIVVVNDFTFKDNGVISVSVPRRYRLKVDIRNLDVELERHEGIGFNNKAYYLFKFYNCKAVNFTGCSTSLHNGKMTSLQLVSCNNITVRNNTFVNYNNCREGGIIWLVGSCENVAIADNTFMKYGNDEVIGFYNGNLTHHNRTDYERRVVRKDITISGNSITYERPSWVKADSIINMDRLISFVPSVLQNKGDDPSTFFFQNVELSGNVFNIRERATRLISLRTDERTRYSNITFANNIVNIDIKNPNTQSLVLFNLSSKGDSKTNEPIKIIGNKLTGRMSKLDNGKNPTCYFAYVSNVNLMVSSNTMDVAGSNNSVVKNNTDKSVEPSADNTIITLLNNTFKRLYLLCSINRSNDSGLTASFTLKAHRNLLEGQTKIYTRNLARADIEYRDNTFNCTGYELLFQNFARQGTLTFTDNTVNFSGRTDYCLYANYEKTGNTDRFTTFDFSNNTIRGVQASKLRTDNIPVARRGARLAGNSFW